MNIDKISKFFEEHSQAFRGIMFFYRKDILKEFQKRMQVASNNAYGFADPQCYRPKYRYDLKQLEQEYERSLKNIIKKSNKIGADVLLVSQVANMLILPSDLLNTESRKETGEQPFHNHINDEAGGRRILLNKSNIGS